MSDQDDRNEDEDGGYGANDDDAINNTWCFHVPHTAWGVCT